MLVQWKIFSLSSGHKTNKNKTRVNSAYSVLSFISSELGGWPGLCPEQPYIYVKTLQAYIIGILLLGQSQGVVGTPLLGNLHLSVESATP